MCALRQVRCSAGLLCTAAALLFVQSAWAQTMSMSSSYRPGDARLDGSFLGGGLRRLGGIGAVPDSLSAKYYSQIGISQMMPIYGSIQHHHQQQQSGNRTPKNLFDDYYRAGGDTPLPVDRLKATSSLVQVTKGGDTPLPVDRPEATSPLVQVTKRRTLPPSEGVAVEEEDWPADEKLPDAVAGYLDNRGEFHEY